MHAAERFGTPVGSGEGVGNGEAAGLALDDLPDGVLVSTLEGRIEATNRVFLELTERVASEVLGRSLLELVVEDDALHSVGFQLLLGEGDARDRAITFSSPGGGRRALLVASTRTRDRRHLILSARASAAVQQALAAASGWVTTQHQRALELSRALAALAANNAALSAARAELAQAHASLQSEAARRTRLEQELRLSQRLESIGQLSAGVAHEINTPMQYIGDNVHFLSAAFDNVMAYLESVTAALDTSVDLSEAREKLSALEGKLRLPFVRSEVPRALSAARDGIEHVSKIIHAMRSFAHQDEQEKEEHDLNRLLGDAITVAQSEYNGVARVDADLNEVPSLRCFGLQLGLVFLNLIVNAAQAIQATNKPELGRIGVMSRARSGWLEVQISDDGCGIPEAIRHRVFDQFFTTKPVGRGSGQGLSLARSIVVDGHAGMLTFETEVGVGTTFSVRLPLAPPAARRPSSDASEPPKDPVEP